MALYLSGDSLKPSNHAIELAYFYTSGVPFGPPVVMDPTGGQVDSLLSAGNTAVCFTYGGNIYRMLTRQTGGFKTLVVKSTDGGATWTVLDSANSPAFESCSGYYDSATATIITVYVSSNAAPAALRLVVFDLVTETWGAVLAAVGPISDLDTSPAIWKRTNGTYLVIYNRLLAAGDSRLSAVSFVPGTATWDVPFDVGAGLTALAGWDATQTSVGMPNTRSIMDPATGIVHCVFSTTSLQTVPVIWGNRCFYQAILLNDTLGSFFDFPGQVAPFPAFPYNQQQLGAYSGAIFGNPIIIGANIIVPVNVRNDSILDRFPTQLPSVYVGTPVAAPVWSLAPVTDPQATIDPGCIVDDFIWAQQTPCLTFDGTTIYASYAAQDADGQNMARVRLCQTTNLVNPFAGWTAVTAFDLQTDAPPAFNFPTQFISGAGIFAAAPVIIVNPSIRLNQQNYPSIPLPDPSKKCY